MARNTIPVWPGWETVDLIGRGRFGTVYEIQRTRAGEVEHAAVKVISVPLSISDMQELRVRGYDTQAVAAHFEKLKDRIEQEYMTMARLKGSVNIVYCEDIRTVPHEEEIGWDIYIKMELLIPLLNALSSPIQEPQVIKLGRDIGQALVMCERENIVHRDIKPQNIFVSKDGTYKLGDFGVAKTIEETGSASVRAGTYDFMAPEVYNGEHYGHKPDLYSLGLVLYWMLNEGCPPFMPLSKDPVSADTASAARQKRFRGDPLPPPAHGSEELKRIVLKACAFDPKDRYQSAEEMLQDLNAIGTVQEAVPVIPKTQVAESPVAVLPAQNSDLTRDVFGDPADFAQEEIPVVLPPQDSNVTHGVFDDPPPPKSAPKKWPAVLGVTAVLVLIAAGLYFLPGWTPATCDAPQTHKLLGITRGEALGHAYGDWYVVKEATCTATGAEERVCANDPTHTEQREIPMVEHSWVDATCEEPSVCSVCGAESGGPIGHDWGTVSYSWSSDNATCTATRVCKNDSTHKETETVGTREEPLTIVTRETAGETRYTSFAFINPDFEIQTKTVDEPPLGYEDGEWVVLKKAYYSDGELVSHSEYTYGAYGITEVQSWENNSYLDQEIQERTVWHYNESGVNDFDTVYDESGKTKGRIEYIYDAYGRIIQEIWYDQNGRKDGSTIYTYNTDGMESLVEYYDANNLLDAQRKYTYNSDGSYQEEFASFTNGSVVYYSIHGYDGYGNDISDETTFYNEDGSVFMSSWCAYSHEYDQSGRLLKTSESRSAHYPSFDELFGLLNDSIVYDNGMGAGDVLKEGAEAVRVVITSYLYDTHGNVISAISSEDNKEVTRIDTEYGFFSNGHLE